MRGLFERVITALSIPMLLVIAISTFIFTPVDSFEQKLESLLQNTLPSLTTSLEISSQLNKANSVMLTVLVHGSNPELAASYVPDLELELDNIRMSFERYEKYEIEATAANLRSTALGHWKAVKAQTAQFIQLAQEKKRKSDGFSVSCFTRNRNRQRTRRFRKSTLVPLRWSQRPGTGF
ncbi:MAG: hypothetical protein ACK5RO_06185 [Pseudobdellovibrionaceae bacterium]